MLHSVCVFCNLRRDTLTEDDEGEDNKISTRHGDAFSFLNDPSKAKDGPVTMEEMLTSLNMTPGEMSVDY